MSILRPKSEEDLVRIVQERTTSKSPVEIIGNGTKRDWGHKVQTEDVLSTEGLSGVLVYEPSELVISARAGTAVREIEEALAAQGQFLAFEPPDLGPFYGLEAGGGTIGGMIATNLFGPRCMIHGAARDHILGFNAVNGRGELFQSGGRVVKNVTGFDLSKLMTGSFGTLGVLTEVTLKVLPAPKQTRTLVAEDLPMELAAKYAQHLLKKGVPISGMVYRSGELAIRFEGTEVSVREQQGKASMIIGNGTELSELDDAASKKFWRKFASADVFTNIDEPVWRLSVPPAEIVQVANALSARDDRSTLIDLGSGLMWLSGEDSEKDAVAIRSATHSVGGSAQLMRGPENLRARVAVFEPKPDSLARVSENVRASFDPLNILNPGKLGGAS